MSRSYVWNVFNTTLDGALLTATTSSASLASATGLRGPGFITIDPDSNSKREVIKFATVNGSNIETLTRGLAGSAAGAQDHTAGTPVRVSVYHQQFDDIWTDIESLETHIGSTAVLDHPEATGSVRGFQSAADKARYDAALATDALLATAVQNDTGTLLPLSGGTMTGNLNMDSNNITNVADPTGANGAMPRSYADDRYAPIVRDVRHFIREQGTGSINTSDGVVASFTSIGMPSGWTTAEVTIRASVQFNNFSGGNVAAVYLRGDGNDGTSRNTATIAAGENGPPVELVLQYTTSQANLDISVRGSLDSGTAGYKFANALILLRRTV